MASGGNSPLTWARWFVPAFLAFAALRSLGLISDFAIAAGIRITAAVLLLVTLLSAICLLAIRFF